MDMDQIIFFGTNNAGQKEMKKEHWIFEDTMKSGITIPVHIKIG